MSIAKNKVVSLEYKLTLDSAEGEMIEETYGKKPLTFLFGIGQMIPAFEENIETKNAGEAFEFLLNAENAYGEFEEKAVINMPIQNFADESGNVDRDKIVIGGPIKMQDMEGRIYQGTVKEISIEKVLIDFNHPMAGKNLYFKGEILEVREATDSELDHGHVHE